MFGVNANEIKSYFIEPYIITS